MVFEFKLPDVGEGVAEGEVVKVGQVRLGIGEKGDQAPAGPAPSTTAPVAAKPAEAPRTATIAPAASKKLQEILATPATRKLARDLGVDLAFVQGTGAGGRITDDDVR